jgi:D-alanyl-D-alanine carboxypeptidase
VAAKRPVTVDTAFAVASLSKTFTAALVMALVEAGSIDLDQSVLGYLPEVGIDPAITVRQLLDHTSGLYDYFENRAIDALLQGDRDRVWTIADALAMRKTSYFAPGQGWRYSNTNYLLLGALAERVGGDQLGNQLRARFLDPLGLGSTWYQPTEAARAPVAHGYRFTGSGTGERAIDLSGDGFMVPFTSVVTAAQGAGGIASTSSDMARWARALYGGGVLTGRTVEAMVDDVARTATFTPYVPYGLGVQRVTIEGAETLGHSGRFLGFRAALRYLPETGLSIAVLTNQSRTDPAIIVRALLRIALDDDRPTPERSIRR